jgi:hypothetical protein
MSHTLRNFLLHFILSTEGRRPLIKSAFDDELFAYLRGIGAKSQLSSGQE